MEVVGCKVLDGIVVGGKMLDGGGWREDVGWRWLEGSC